ncbi:citrate/tricarballylate utilization protein [Rhodopseudomonas rhenobacensis]|uniref:Citrate/tricarballylate utilization protein n=1 Tax=Rhodopseudomonas rhenobacensis TaxID=87461 RepID=A0A7W7Z266_9BRAD|nr:tricarballylate utilization 4Fe-4S protein TcuB [Rhodopseudomonas rhenobacensis]MBB5046597.1 citrate/tricarballylate utilization protein [Rhodopseudomonas rhenobacensis]
MPPDDLTDEADRVLRICTACMYCDGLCAVFPAIAGKHDFTPNDLDYLANLCHNCRGCWYACQYAPPHPFAVNLPNALAELRQRSYADYAWPRWLGAGFAANAGVVTAIVGGVTTLTLLATALLVPAEVLFAAHRGAGAFYQVVPWPIMAGAAAAALLWAVISIGVSAISYWRSIAPRASLGATLRALVPALRDIVTLRNLGGGGPGCNDASEKFSQQRRWCHHIMVAGFLASVASTLIAALYHHALAIEAPYPLTSLPVLSGGIGGVAMLIGIGGLLRLERRADRAPSAAAEVRLNLVFLVLLALVAASGLAVLALRDTPAMGLTLSLHLGLVIGSFVVLPVSKAVHGVYRSMALLRAAIDRAVPRPRRGGEE